MNFRLFCAIGFVAILALTLVLLPFFATDEASGQKTADPEVAVDITDAPNKLLRIEAGKTMLLSINRPGGTGFFWDAKVKDPSIANVEYFKSRSEKTGDEPKVGVREADIFKLTALTTGHTELNFSLRKARSDAVRFQVILIDVVDVQQRGKS